MNAKRVQRVGERARTGLEPVGPDRVRGVRRRRENERDVYKTRGRRTKDGSGGRRGRVDAEDATMRFGPLASVLLPEGAKGGRRRERGHGDRGGWRRRRQERGRGGLHDGREAHRLLEARREDTLDDVRSGRDGWRRGRGHGRVMSQRGVPGRRERRRLGRRYGPSDERVLPLDQLVSATVSEARRIGERTAG